jgi:hypothetical protein
MNKMEEENVDDFFKLSYKPNPKYPSFADCIELRSNRKYGRYLVTNQDLKVGDIIAIEEFFYYSINDDRDEKEKSGCLMNYQFCAFCHKSKLLDLVPCDQCVFTMYCDEKCRENNIRRGHFFECSQMGSLIITAPLHTAITAFFTALSICNNSIDDLEELIKEAYKFQKPMTVFDFDFSKMTEIEKKKKLVQIVYCGQRRKLNDEEIKCTAKLIQCVFMRSLLTAAMLKANTKFIVNFISIMNEIQSQNSFALHKEVSKLGEGTVCAGDGICPGLSLLNHSCAPNVMHLHIDKRFALIVTRKIQKGEQIFDAYT